MSSAGPAAAMSARLRPRPTRRPPRGSLSAAPPAEALCAELCAAVGRLRAATERLRRRLGPTGSGGPDEGPDEETESPESELTELAETMESELAESAESAEGRSGSPLIVELLPPSGIQPDNAAEEGAAEEAPQRAWLRSRVVAIEEEAGQYVSDLLVLQRDVAKAQKEGLIDRQSSAARWLELGVRDELNASCARSLKIAALRDKLQDYTNKID